jgi:hypothetical protein
LYDVLPLSFVSQTEVTLAASGFLVQGVDHEEVLKEEEELQRALQASANSH